MSQQVFLKGCGYDITVHWLINLCYPLTVALLILRNWYEIDIWCFFRSAFISLFLLCNAKWRSKQHKYSLRNWVFDRNACHVDNIRNNFLFTSEKEKRFTIICWKWRNISTLFLTLPKTLKRCYRLILWCFNTVLIRDYREA